MVYLFILLFWYWHLTCFHSCYSTCSFSCLHYLWRLPLCSAFCCLSFPWKWCLSLFCLAYIISFCVPFCKNRVCLMYRVHMMEVAASPDAASHWALWCCWKYSHYWSWPHAVTFSVLQCTILHCSDCLCVLPLLESLQCHCTLMLLIPVSSFRYVWPFLEALCCSGVSLPSFCSALLCDLMEVHDVRKPAGDVSFDCIYLALCVFLFGSDWRLLLYNSADADDVLLLPLYHCPFDLHSVLFSIPLPAFLTCCAVPRHSVGSALSGWCHSCSTDAATTAILWYLIHCVCSGRLPAILTVHVKWLFCLTVLMPLEAACSGTCCVFDACSTWKWKLEVCSDALDAMLGCCAVLSFYYTLPLSVVLLFCSESSSSLIVPGDDCSLSCHLLLHCVHF